MKGLSELVPDLLLGGFGGAALAALHLRLLWRATRRLDGASGLGRLVAGGALRQALLVGGFALLGAVAPDPAMAMIVGLVAFTLFRMIALRILRRAEVG